jgi:hypothetical protein
MRDRITSGGWTWEAVLRRAQQRPDVRARVAASIRERQRQRVAQGLWHSPSQRPEVAAKISAARRQQERARRIATGSDSNSPRRDTDPSR